MTEKNQEKASSDAWEQVLERLSFDQIRFIVARQEFSTDKEAAEEIGIKPNTVYQWRYDGYPIDDALRMIGCDGVVAARVMRRKSLAKAMAVKVKGLDSDNERVRQGVSTEIIEWEMGRSVQRQEIAGADGGPLTFRIVLSDGKDDTAV